MFAQKCIFGCTVCCGDAAETLLARACLTLYVCGVYSFYSDPLHFIAAVPDPRYKDNFLNAKIKQRARKMIQTVIDADSP